MPFTPKQKQMMKKDVFPLAITYNEEAKAATIASQLVVHGYGVYWDRELPNTVLTTATLAEVKEVSKKNPSIDNNWYRYPSIDFQVGYTHNVFSR